METLRDRPAELMLSFRSEVGRRRLGQVALCGSYLCAALLLCAPAIFRPGWPQSHEQLSPFERVECFRRALAFGTLIPTWSQYPFMGFGSPFPLLYHRLFNSLGGALALFFSSSVIAVKTLIPALLFVGGIGQYRLCRELAVYRWLSWAAGLLLMAAPYTIVDWLVRGAVAEFTAAMIFPWWLAACLGLLTPKRRWVSLGLLTAALFHAHSGICLFALPLAALLLVIAFSTRSLTLRAVHAEWQRVACATVLLLGLVLPFVLAMARVIPSVATATFTNFTSPAKEFKPLIRYFVDEGFNWGAGYRGVSVELNRYLVVAALSFGFGAAALQIRVRRNSTRCLLGMLGLCLFLQLPVSNWLYVHVPGALYLQFPWRLNAFMTPILIALLCVAGQSCAQSSKRACAWVQVVVAGCLLLSLEFPVRALELDYARYSSRALDESVASLSDDVAGIEYLPKGVAVETPKAVSTSRRRHDHGPPPQANSSPEPLPLIASDCAVSWPTQFTGNSLRLAISSDRECHVAIRQFLSPVLSLQLENATLLASDAQNRLQFLVHPGRSLILVSQKSVVELAAEFVWRR